GRYDAATAWAEDSYTDLPSFLMTVSIIAASRALSGRLAEAQQAMEQLRKLDPALRITNLRKWLPINRDDNFAVFAEGLRKAGLPER
ncbi:MAG: CadC-family transcriptional regulator, partial [Pseudaminobacter sp.]